MEIIALIFGLLIGVIQTRRYYVSRIKKLETNVQILEHQINTLEVYNVSLVREIEAEWVDQLREFDPME